MSRLAAALILAGFIFVSNCASSVPTSNQLYSAKFQAGKLEHSIGRELKQKGGNLPSLLRSANKLTEKQKDDYRQMVDIMSGQPGVPPQAFSIHVQKLYSRLLQKKDRHVSAPLLIIDDCLGASARLTPALDIELCRDSLRILSSDDEVAFLVAHELSHYLLEHSVNVAKTPALGISLDITLEHSAHLWPLSSRARSRREYGLLESLGYVSKQTVKEDILYSARQESDADLFAIDLMVEAGLSPDGAYTAIEKLGGSNSELADTNKSHLPVANRQELVLDYIDRFHAKADMREQNMFPWVQNPTRDMNIYLTALKYLADASLQLSLAHLHSKLEYQAIIQGSRDTTNLPAHSEKNLFCLSAMSNIVQARIMAFPRDRKAVEMAASLATICQFMARSYSLAAFESIISTPADGAWRILDQAFILNNMGMPDERKTAKVLVDQLYDGYGEYLAVLGSGFLFNRLIYPNKRSGKYMQTCKKYAGTRFGPIDNDRCLRYLNVIILQINKFADTRNMKTVGDGKELYRDLYYPDFLQVLPGDTFISSKKYTLKSWHLGGYAQEGVVIPRKLNVRTGPGRNYKIAYTEYRQNLVMMTGRRKNGWVEIAKRGKFYWVYGELLFRTGDAMEYHEYEARKKLEYSVSDREPDRLGYGALDTKKIWRTGRHPMK